MAGEYIINLTNGSVLTTVHPLEVEGGTSTARQVVSITFPSTFKLNGRLAYRFVPGFTFNFINVQNPADPNIGTYTVLSSSETGLITDPDSIVFTNIIVTTAIPNTSSLPLGQIQYSVSATSPLHLGGRGVMNWAEDMLESSVHITENFANTTAPAVPIKGQHWYRTLSGSEGMLVFDGSAWSSTVDVDAGELHFKDTQNSNADIILTAAAPGDTDIGLSLRPSIDPSGTTSSLFRVVNSASTTEYFRVERGSYTRTVNNLEVKGTGDSYVYGRLGVGANGVPSVTNTLTVEGSGIDVNGDTGYNANLNLNALSTMKSRVGFVIGNLTKSEIFVDGTAAGTPLEINNSFNTNVHLVSGTSTGNVGIGNSNPQAKLDVTGDAWLSKTSAILRIGQNTGGNTTSGIYFLGGPTAPPIFDSSITSFGGDGTDMSGSLSLSCRYFNLNSTLNFLNARTYIEPNNTPDAFIVSGWINDSAGTVQLLTPVECHSIVTQTVGNTLNVNVYNSNIRLQSGSTVTTLQHFVANSFTQYFGTSTVTNQTGFFTDISNGSSSNVGYQSAIPDTASNYNFYASTSTQNLFKGPLYINVASAGPALSATVASGNAVNVAGGPINMNSNKVISVTDPTNPQDAATKKYVDDKFNLALALAVIGW
jgi:hypothetical protein